jgi:hypothetical protein
MILRGQFSTKKRAVSILKVAPWAQMLGECAGVVFELSFRNH